mmetsp:Transcript_10503/g.19065  ORF Transcript_10503/g.19065 Transcript_10503/m.19065 type:complete len:112 (-) Transcript_10503:936-1271(-)
MVRAVFSVYFNPKRGTKYPTKKPILCNIKTEPIIQGSKDDEDDDTVEPTSTDALLLTTPPQIIATSKTLAKGVKRDKYLDTPGALALSSIPRMTGSNTTRAVAEQSAKLLT